MKTTLLDDYVKVCLDLQDRIPMYRHMVQVIQETRPLLHMWRVPVPDEDMLPATPLVWPDPAFMLWSTHVMVPGRHRFAVDVDTMSEDPDFKLWFDHKWSLDGLLVITRPGYERFEVLPVVTQNSGPMILTDAQLSFELTPDGWAWNYACIGPNNAFFHNWFKSRLDEEELAAVEENVNLLGNTVSDLLAGYYKHLQQDGQWKQTPVKPPRVKLDAKGQIRKTIRPGTLGYKEYITDGN